jgi:MFS transporter, putative metabolite:H+ symporter
MSDGVTEARMLDEVGVARHSVGWGDRWRRLWCTNFPHALLAVTSDSQSRYLLFGAVSIATLGWLWGVGDTYIAELFPTVLRGTGFGIAVGGGRVVSIAAPTVIGWGITQYGLQAPYLALSGLWALTLIGYLAGPETKGKELEELADEAFAEPSTASPAH